MFRIFRKKQKHVMVLVEQGRSGKHQAFDLFDKGKRPSDIYNDNLIPFKKTTLFRYHEEWKQRRIALPDYVYKDFLRHSFQIDRGQTGALANYFNISEAELVAKLERPVDFLMLLEEISPGDRLYSIRYRIEKRLEVAFKQTILAENLYDNPPEQVGKIIVGLLTLEDNTKLVISKEEGRLTMRKEPLNNADQLDGIE